MTNVDHLLMLDDDAIDYEALPDETLQTLALEVEPFIATSALTELAVRGSAAAGETAWSVLNRPEEDQHLRALALEVLFDADPDRAIAYMNDFGLADQDLRKAMVQIVAEHPDSIAHEPGATLARQLLQGEQASPTTRVAPRRAAVTAARNRPR